MPSMKYAFSGFLVALCLACCSDRNPAYQVQDQHRVRPTDGPMADRPAPADAAPPPDRPRAPDSRVDRAVELGPPPPDLAQDQSAPDQAPPPKDITAADWPIPPADSAPPDSLSCAPGLAACGGACVDLAASAAHCGKCGQACAAGLGCLAAKCTPPSAWRSALYPANWTPALTDKQGRFVHDFSYAGYQLGQASIPDQVSGAKVKVTDAPFSADPTGKADATTAIQQALDQVGKQGGGVVLLPAGTYRVKPQGSASAALYLRHSNVVLRGAGRARSFIFNDATAMRGKSIIRVAPTSSGAWTSAAGSSHSLATNTANRAREVLLTSTAGYAKGDWVVLRADSTPAWVAQHGMSGVWPSSVGGPLFLRRLTGVTPTRLLLDIPLRYPLLLRDKARVYRARPQLQQVGLEDFSLGNRQHPGTSGWGDNDYSKAGTSAHAVHASRAISLAYVVHGWVRRVNTYRPAANKGPYHILSDGLQLYHSRNVTVQRCVFAHPQYEGGGGNGYSFVLQGSDNLLQDCASVSARHAYSFKKTYATGNVIRAGSSSNPRLATDFHMHLSLANLLDGVVLDRDFVDATYRPWGTTIHGHTTTQSVIWNTLGLRAHSSSAGVAVDSRQYGWGLVIGTRGAVPGVRTTPLKDTRDTAPEDWLEGDGHGGALAPASLHQDQLYRRLHGGAAPPQSGPAVRFVAPAADTYVRDGGHASTNFGAATSVAVKQSGSGFNRQALLRFDLGGYQGTVARARLVLYGRTSDGGGTMVQTRVHGVNDDSWSESKVTWSTRPALGAYQSRQVINSVDAWRVFDVTRFVQAQLAGDKVVSLALVQAVGKGLYVSFHSREHGNARPRLELIGLPGKRLAIKAVATASAAAPGTAPSYSVDGKLTTRWSSQGLGAQITYDLGAVRQVNGLALALHQGDQRITFFELQASTTGASWTTLRGAQSPGDRLTLQHLPLPQTSARYLRLVGLGNAKDGWFSISEVQIFGP